MIQSADKNEKSNDFSEDISDGKLNSRNLGKCEKNQENIFDFFSDSVFICCNRKVVSVNDKAIKLIGYKSSNEIIGEDIGAILNPHLDYTEEMNNIVNQLESGLDVSNIKQKLITKDKSVLCVEVSGTPYRYSEEPTIMIIIHDITEIKKADETRNKLDEAIRSDKLKTDFFSNTSHELKTPLNIILASIQLIHSIHEESMDCTKYKKVNKYMNTMKQNCYRLLRLINNLIDITKLEVDFLNMNLGNYNIVSVVEDITLSVAEYTQSKNISLIFDTDIEEKMIALDVEKVERVILNLLSNAVKFTESHGKIYVKVCDGKDRVFISIRDTGIGIPKDKLHKIFDRFNQVNSTLVKNLGGSGIGLSLVKSIVEAHGGNINVKSEYRMGSEFIIELPVKLVYNDSRINMGDAFLGEKNTERVNIELSDIY